MDTLSGIAHGAVASMRRLLHQLAPANLLTFLVSSGLPITQGQLDGTAPGTATDAVALQQAITTCVAVITGVRQVAEQIVTAVDTGNLPSPEALKGQFNDLYAGIANIKTALVTIKTILGRILSSNTDVAALVERATASILVDYLDGIQPRVGAILNLLGAVEYRYNNLASNPEHHYLSKQVNLHNITKVISDPYALLQDVYGWNTGAFNDKELVRRLSNVLYALGIPAYFEPALTQDDYELQLGGGLSISRPGNASKALKISLDSPAVAHAPLRIALDGWLLSYFSTVPVSTDVYLDWQGNLSFTAAPSVAGEIGVSFTLPAQAANANYALLTTPFGLGISVRSVTISLGLIVKIASGVGIGEPSIRVALEQLRVEFNAAATDGFVSKILAAKSFSFTSDVAISWSRQNGFHFEGSAGLSTTKPLNIKVGPVEIINVILSIVPDTDGIQLVGTGSVRALLGPVTLLVEELGVAAELVYGSGNVGPFGFDIDLSPPKGVGIGIKSDALNGGGYLYIDKVNQKYAGVATLNFKDKLNLNAVGILNTKLPNNRPGYSLLLLITAEFKPLQLGLGFTLNAVGGLVGINRIINVDNLRRLVQNGQTDSLLFPANVLANAQAAIATVDSAFPAAEGKYVFGLMAKIGWGSPNLVTLDAALIIQLPAPVVLVLLGVLRATLPNMSSPIIRLRADFIGIVDFGAKKISFDAVLVKSSVLQFSLDGTFAFRLYQGDNPVFLMTAGGFHPAFHPPANADLPTQRRLTLALSNSNDFRLTLTSYLAITSNTVQFGSRLELYADLPGPFTLQGYLGFDALFRFNPFYLEVHIGAGVAIKKGSRSVLSISLDLLVSGPAPWHVDGTGKFKVLFLKIKFRIDRTFGGRTTQPALPATNIRELLLAALQDKANWAIEQPAIKPANTVVLRTEDQPTELVVDPGGMLVVRQKVVPLSYAIEVYGNTAPVNGNRFAVTAVQLGAGNTATDLTGTDLSEMRDSFSPGQFRRMKDAEKLSAPSFQLLPSGVRLTTIDGLEGGVGTTRVIAFEERIFAPAPTAQNRPAPSNNSNGTPVPSVGTTAATRIPGSNLQRLARTGAIGQSRRSYEQRRPSRKAPDRVLWDEDSYVVVSVRTLEPYESTPSTFPTEAEATVYLTSLLAEDATLVGEYQVLPVYQLDVSAPSLTANLATT